MGFHEDCIEEKSVFCMSGIVVTLLLALDERVVVLHECFLLEQYCLLTEWEAQDCKNDESFSRR